MINDSNEKKQFIIRVPSNIIEKVKFIAAHNGRTANKEIERLLIYLITRFEKKNGEITLDNPPPPPLEQNK